MNYKLKQHGFSLAEILIALGILSLSLVFIAGVFPVGIHFTTVSMDRTIAAVIADEAFAKVKLYSYVSRSYERINMHVIEEERMRDFNDWYDVTLAGSGEELTNEVFTYPSSPDVNVPQRKYCWSALCRRVEDIDNDRQVQVTVFISSKAGFNRKYHEPDHSDFNNVSDYGTDTDSGGGSDWPFPVKVGVTDGPQNNELRILGDRTFINDGYTIVDDRYGQIYRVLERYPDNRDDIVLLDRDWKGENFVWVVPPPKSGGKYPCIAVYQRVMRL